jgi:hypothetical protein
LRRLLSATGVLPLLLVGSVARGAVTEPNGVAVPVNVASGGVYLGTWFTGEGETFDVVADAAATPGAFSPLCDFSATLVLRDSSAKAGISWYNTTADGMGPLADSDVHAIVPPGTAVGSTVSSADIRTSMDYLGGLVGFALVRDDDNSDTTPPTITYYSEFKRNALCSGCTGAGMMADYWKAALIYPSTVHENTFYLAFEDWGGASAAPSTWYNDGDFNDQVFRITGVACPGSGAACDTGKPGICQPGLTECVAGGTLDCKPQLEPTDESCDGLDNDCDGDIDNGDLCPTGQVCDRGTCVTRCSDLADTCESTEVCSDAGYCVDAACADVTCDAGKKCTGGECHAPCEGVVCPASNVCLAGRCADPCVGVTCGNGRVCDRGVCVPTCDCQVCGAGLECATDGRCVPEGCAGKECASGEACVAGSCVDACDGAACPTGEKCTSGACVDACTGVACDAGQKCLAGNCTDSCTGVHCLPGQNCVPGADSQGECADAADCTTVPCENASDVCVDGVCMNPCMACTTSQSCVDGACVDACTGVACGTDETCRAGVCVGTAPPAMGGGTGGGGGSSGTTLGGSGPMGIGGTATGGSGRGGSGAGTATPAGDDEPPDQRANPSCACRTGSSSDDGLGGLVAFGAWGLALVRRWRYGR